MLESGITAKMLKILRAEGAWALKTHGELMQIRGIPDILACVNGRFVAIEGKRDKKKSATDLQKLTLREIRAAGGIGVVAHDAMGVRLMLNQDLLVCPRCLEPLKDGGCDACL